jgi:hypothetical protein
LTFRCNQKAKSRKTVFLRKSLKTFLTKINQNFSLDVHQQQLLENY